MSYIQYLLVTLVSVPVVESALIGQKVSVFQSQLYLKITHVPVPEPAPPEQVIGGLLLK